MSLPDIKNITITTLSPIHIGCDEDYVPTNFVIADELLHYLDPVVLAEHLDDAERAQLAKLADSKEAIGAIQRFFKSRRERFVPLSSHTVEVAADIARNYEANVGKPVQQGAGGEATYNLFPIARTAFRSIDHAPYLPGSSLKGAMRTAWLDKINQGKPALDEEKRDKTNGNRAMQQRLLGYANGKFENDPLRHLHVVDAHHDEETESAPAHILYAVSKKKRPSERGSPELKIFLETIPSLLNTAFSGEIRLTGDKITWQRLCAACNAFYYPQLQAELRHAHLSSLLNADWSRLVQGLMSDEIKTLCENHQGFLLRVGRHSGAESVTLNGVRDIKILGKKGDQPSYRPETTEKRLASQTKGAVDGLLPFGWIWIESCEDRYQHVSISLHDKIRPHTDRLRAGQRARQEAQEQVTETRRIAALAAEQQRQAAEAAAQQAAAAQAARESALAAMTPNLRQIEELRAEIEKRLAAGRKLPISDQFWGGHIKKLALTAAESPDWNADEKTELADMLQEWAPKLMALDAKDLRKQLKLAALRGQA